MRGNAPRCLLFALAALLVSSARAAEPAGDETPGRTQAVVVEAVGLAPLAEGADAREAHRQALLDARLNALQQAHVTVESSSRVRAMRLQETSLSTWVAGYVRQMDVLEAGPVRADGAPLYRVRVRAQVQPLPDSALGGVAGQPRWQPRLRLALTYEGPAEKAPAFRSALERAVRRCGIDVLGNEDPRPALHAEVRLIVRGRAGQGEISVEWTLGFGPADGDADSGPLPTASGDWRLKGTVEPEPAWWRGIGLRIAQEATRLWALPRPTRMFFGGLSEEGAGALRSAIGRLRGARVQTGSKPGDVAAVVLVVGDPAAVAENLLARAGLRGVVEPRKLSMAELVYGPAGADTPSPAEPE